MSNAKILSISPVSTTKEEEKKRPPKRRRRWPLVLAVSILGLGLFFAIRGRAKPAQIDPALIVTATRKSLEVEVLETGRIQPREKVDLKSKIPGQVQSVLVQEGATVKKGDVLLVLDPTDYQRDLAKADAEVARATAALEFAKLTHQRAERGVAQGVASRFEIDQTAHDERTTTATLRAADVARGVAQDRLRYTKLVSPIDGTVIARGIEPGESVVPGVQSTFDGKALLTVADLSALLVKVNLNQIDVAKISVGRKATLTLDALPGRIYRAVVTKVAPASVKVAGKDQEVFPIEAQLEAPDGLVKPGMTADVRVHLDAKQGVLCVPLEVIVKESGRTYVMRIVDKQGRQELEKTEVTLGLRNDREVEISGIEDGARVMLRPPSAAENETKL
jgi:HlyD family secretion protein/macrolide-specific efflux system membrane fusion protein